MRFLFGINAAVADIWSAFRSRWRKGEAEAAPYSLDCSPMQPLFLARVRSEPEQAHQILWGANASEIGAQMLQSIFKVDSYPVPRAGSRRWRLRHDVERLSPPVGANDEKSPTSTFCFV